MFSARYIQLQAEKDHGLTCVESGGLAIHQITATIVENRAMSFNHQLPQFRLEINVSADKGKKYASNFAVYLI